MNDNFLAKELERACLKLDSLTQSGTAAKLIAAKTQERIDSYAKMEGSKAKKVAARIATEGLDPQWSLRAVQEQVGELLAGRVLGNTPAPQQATPAPTRLTPPPPPAPKRTPEQAQQERDEALLAEYSSIADSGERIAWFRANGPAYNRAFARITNAREDAKQAATMASFQKERDKATKQQQAKLAQEYRGLTNVMSRRLFDQKHPGVADAVEAGTL